MQKIAEKQLTFPLSSAIITDVAGAQHLRQSRIWGYSSAGRALEWHSRGQRFDPAYLHQDTCFNRSGCFLFVLPAAVWFRPAVRPCPGPADRQSLGRPLPGRNRSLCRFLKDTHNKSPRRSRRGLCCFYVGSGSVFGTVVVLAFFAEAILLALADALEVGAVHVDDHAGHNGAAHRHHHHIVEAVAA